MSHRLLFALSKDSTIYFLSLHYLLSLYLAERTSWWHLAVSGYIVYNYNYNYNYNYDPNAVCSDWSSNNGCSTISWRWNQVPYVQIAVTVSSCKSSTVYMIPTWVYVEDWDLLLNKSQRLSASKPMIYLSSLHKKYSDRGTEWSLHLPPVRYYS